MSARNLRAVEEGDPGHHGRRKLEQRLTSPRALPAEPDWRVVFPGDDREAAQLRTTAEAEWAGVVGPLHKLGVLSGPLDVRALMDYCICCARLDEAERDITMRGITVPGRMGDLVKNPSVSCATQYRGQLRALLTHLGLSPNARAGLKKPDVTDDGEDSPWSR